MIIKDSVIRGLMEDDSPCKPRSNEDVVPKIMTQCTNCNNRVLLAISRLSKCPICSSLYDTSTAPMIKFISKGDESVVESTINTNVDSSIDVI